PQMDAPGQCPARNRPKAEIVEGTGLVHMKPALRLLACLDRQRRGQALALAPAGRKRLDGPDVGHGVDQLATGKIGLLRPGTVQGPAPSTAMAWTSRRMPYWTAMAQLAAPIIRQSRPPNNQRWRCTWCRMNGTARVGNAGWPAWGVKWR